MDAKAISELADAMLKTLDTREASYDHTSTSYKLSYYQAADKAKVPNEIRDLVTGMLIAGYCDFPEWAEKRGKAAKLKRLKEQIKSRARRKLPGR